MMLLVVLQSFKSGHHCHIHIRGSKICKLKRRSLIPILHKNNLFRFRKVLFCQRKHCSDNVFLTEKHMTTPVTIFICKGTVIYNRGRVEMLGKYWCMYFYFRSNEVFLGCRFIIIIENGYYLYLYIFISCYPNFPKSPPPQLSLKLTAP